MEKTKRIEWIDELKGFAIFLVVFGHLIQSKMLPVNGWLHSAIYSFHMPLFMFLSGMFAYKALVKNVNEWCIFSINKFLQLIVPCLIFQFISCHLNFTKFIGAMVMGGVQYWFLVTLFGFMILLSLSSLIKNRKLQLAFLTLAFVSVALVPDSSILSKFLNKDHFLFTYPFFILGLMYTEIGYLKTLLSG